MFAEGLVHLGLMKKKPSAKILRSETMNEYGPTNDKRYSCGLEIMLIGRAIAVNMDTATEWLNATQSDVSKPHVTIMFRERGFNITELTAMRQFRDEWALLKAIPKGTWEGMWFYGDRRCGAHSYRVAGRLKYFVIAAQTRFATTWGAETRLPHIKTYSEERREECRVA